jgi:hypothetical protein
MPRSTRFVKVVRLAPILSLGIGLLVVAGCGPPEAGSVKLPEELRRGTKPRYGPGAVKAGTRLLGPGQSRAEASKPPGEAIVRPR